MIYSGVDGFPVADAASCRRHPAEEPERACRCCDVCRARDEETCGCATAYGRAAEHRTSSGAPRSLSSDGPEPLRCLATYGRYGKRPIVAPARWRTT